MVMRTTEYPEDSELYLTLSYERLKSHLDMDSYWELVTAHDSALSTPSMLDWATKYGIEACCARCQGTGRYGTVHEDRGDGELVAVDGVCPVCERHEDVPDVGSVRDLP